MALHLDKAPELLAACCWYNKNMVNLGGSVLLIMAQLVSFFWPSWSKASFSSVSWLLFPHISLKVALLLQNSESEFWKPLFFLIPAIWRGNDEVLCVWDPLFFLVVSSLVQFESTSDCQMWRNINSAVGWHAQVESWGTSWTNELPVLSHLLGDVM